MNRLSKIVLTYAVVLTVSVSLSACSSSSSHPRAAGTDSSTANSDTSSASPVEPSSQSPAPAVNPNTVELSDSWTDEVGYSYSVKVDSFSANTSVDTAGALPGKAVITYSYVVSGSVSNTTAGRIAPMPNYELIDPIWSAGSPVCGALSSSSNQAFASNEVALQTKYCSVLQGGAAISPKNASGTLAIGATVPAVSMFGYKISVDEATAQVVAAALKTPEMWITARNSGAGWQTSCLVRSGAYYVTQSTGATGCHS